MMQEIVKSSFGDKGLDPRPEEFDLVSRVFQKAGGSWERVFLGSNRDVVLLKKALKIAVLKDIFTKSPKWGV